MRITGSRESYTPHLDMAIKIYAETFIFRDVN